jgi:RNA polymerase sigma factor (sigma-70 family)
MQVKSDAQLLRDYAGHGDEAAFREIVTRHTDLVYSAALRQVGSPDFAGDVTQSVFMDLARKATSVGDGLPAEASLVGWLYRSTRYAAFNHSRAARRRAAHERLAMEQLIANSEAGPDWDRVRPVLDEAMAALDDDDREALLLRYFKNQDFRAVGAALGISDDAAQKRVSRAVERLRELFASRGVTVGAGGLVVVIAANAVQAAPAGLAAMISTAALAGTAITTTIATATKAIAMTTLQKALVAATIAIVAGAGIYEAHQASQLRDQVQTLQQQQAPLADQLRQLQQERDTATNRLAADTAQNEMFKSNQEELVKLRGEVAQLRDQLARSQAASSVNTNDPFTQSVLALAAKAAQLNRYLDQMPDKRIPEIQLLAPDDWLNAAKQANFDTDAKIRKSLSKLRSLAKNRLPMGYSLSAFTLANNGQLPTDLSQLKPYMQTKLGDAAPDDTTLDAILGRYALLHTGNLNDYPSGTWFIGEKAPVDSDYDSRAKFGYGTSTTISTGIGEAGDPDDPSY